MLLQHLSRFVIEICAPAAVFCWPTRWPRLHIAPCCSTLIQHYSTTRFSVLMTSLPRYVDRSASMLQMSSVSCLGIQLRLHRRVHVSSRCSSRRNGNSLAALGACSRYRPIRFRGVKSARVAFPTARLHSLQANAMSGRSDARYASLADTLC